MKLYESINAVRQCVQEWRQHSHHIGFVPTMGNLHAGHLSLVRAAQAQGNKVMVSIFVNPTQFGPNEDFEAYPRTLSADIKSLESIGCDGLFIPSVAMLYPDSSARTRILAAQDLSAQLCGASRPGHFDGVCLVVNKLLNIVMPDQLFLGEKDRQQLLIIERMLQDFNLSSELIAVPTLREASGLAMSSRNQYLSEADKRKASNLFACMNDTALLLNQAAAEIPQLELHALNQLKEQGFEPDYFKILCAKSLMPVTEHTQKVGVFVAAKLGRTRLIDNIVVERTIGQ